MPIFGLRQRELGPLEYYFSDEDLRLGEYALVETGYGSAVALASSGPLQSLPGSDAESLPRVLRKANDEDLAAYESNKQLAAQAKVFCKERIVQRKLEMKVVDVEVFFDRSKFIFYFTAPTRIDFRDLVKDLVREYRARIELRQIGARHESQMVGAIGNCGQICCCRRYLHKFAPVTIRMAKEQRLFLNPSKISGICGRLLCCLSYEQDNYEKFHKESPKPGKRYHTAKGVLKVLRVNMFKNTITALDEESQETIYSRDEWDAMKPWRSSHDAADAPEMDDMFSYPEDPE